MARKKRKRRKKQGAGDAAATIQPELPSFVQLLVETPAATLDLHGLTADQALRRMRDFFRTQSRVAPGKVVHIVTGRGTRSPGAPVLPRVAHEALAGELSEFVEDVAGLPGGGALAVRLV
jgi:DNA-nicking Smr family endonuclease